MFLTQDNRGLRQLGDWVQFSPCCLLGCWPAHTRADLVSFPTASTPPCPQPPPQASDAGAVGAGFSPSHSRVWWPGGLALGPWELMRKVLHYFFVHSRDQSSLALKSREVSIAHCDPFLGGGGVGSLPEPLLPRLLSSQDCTPVYAAQVTLT